MKKLSRSILSVIFVLIAIAKPQSNILAAPGIDDSGFLEKLNAEYGAK